MRVKEQISSKMYEREIWTVAFRSRTDKLLYQGNAKEFRAIRPSVRYWIADPFLLKYRQTNYLFVEMFDRFSGKGVIGVAKLKNGKCGRFHVCLDLPHHLSYPCLFEKDGVIYMMPECSGSGEVTVFKAVQFPLKWEPAYTVCKGQYVDTTPVFAENGEIMCYLSSRFDEMQGGNDNLCMIDTIGNVQVIAENCRVVRPAGHLIQDGIILRPAQDDTDTYGCGLFFYRVNEIGEANFAESKMLRVCTQGCKKDKDDLAIEIAGDSRSFIGVHTYNQNEDYEVIDLLVQKQFSFYLCWKNKKKIYKMAKKAIKGKIRFF